LFGRAEGERPLGRPWSRWKSNIRMYVREIVWEFVVWMHLAGSCEHDNEPSGFIKVGEFLE
jgi:hypothetical protein